MGCVAIQCLPGAGLPPDCGAASPDPGRLDLGCLDLGSLEVLIRSIVHFKLGAARNTAQDVEDVSSEVLLRLLTVLDQGASIADLPSYVARVSYNACNEYFRRRFPGRHRLKLGLRHTLRETSGFALWADARQGWLCGFAGWIGQPPVSCASLAIPPAVQPLSSFLRELFHQAAGPLLLDHLVDRMMEGWTICEHPVTLDSVAEQLQTKPVENHARDHQRTLQSIWREVVALPLPQRRALLLNLRAPDGTGALKLFPLTAVASIRAIAMALEIKAEEFALQWNSLPLDDATIAAGMGLTRQQVINLRKSARKRLNRRLQRSGFSAGD